MFKILFLYSRPYDPLLPVVCIDEKLVELRQSVREGYRDRKGIRVCDYEYRKNGTANLFVATEPKGGTHYVRTTNRRTKKDFAKFLKWLESQYSKAITIHLVMDNLNTHRESSLIEMYGETEGSRLWARFTVHYTPVHASWLNQAEIAIGAIAKATLGERISSIDVVRKKTIAFAASMRKQKWKINWGFTIKRAKHWISRVENHRLKTS